MNTIDSRVAREARFKCTANELKRNGWLKWNGWSGEASFQRKTCLFAMCHAIEVFQNQISMCVCDKFPKDTTNNQNNHFLNGNLDANCYLLWERKTTKWCGFHTIWLVCVCCQSNPNANYKLGILLYYVVSKVYDCECYTSNDGNYRQFSKPFCTYDFCTTFNVKWHIKTMSKL